MSVSFLAVLLSTFHYRWLLQFWLGVLLPLACRARFRGEILKLCFIYIISLFLRYPEKSSSFLALAGLCIKISACVYCGSPHCSILHLER